MSRQIAFLVLAVLTLAPLSVPAATMGSDVQSADSDLQNADSGVQNAGKIQSKKLRVAGYFSQAYATTDGHQILGIPDDGTSAYYHLAMQFVYDPTANDTFVVQFSRERQGRSPIQPLLDEVEIDWAFYRHQFSSGTSVKVGRVPIPIGILNELRDVGTVLPFFFPPYSIYTEGQFTNESVDGLVVSQRFFPQSSWSLDADIYGGRWKSREYSLELNLAEETDIDHALGVQLWLQTPVPGLRFGAGALRYDVSNGLFRAAESDRWKAALVSVDGDFEHFLVRAEAYRRKIPLGLSTLPISIPDVSSDSLYVQAGYRFDTGWSIFGQVEEGRIAFDPVFLPAVDRPFWKDQALSLGYSFEPKFFSTSTQVAIRLELHHNESYFVEDLPAPNILLTPPAETKYALLSVSFSIF